MNIINKPTNPMLSSKEIVPSTRVYPRSTTVKPKGAIFHK